MGPILHEIACEYAGVLKVVEVNVDQNASIATKYSVQSVPTFMLFIGGQIKDRFSGFTPGERLLTRLRAHLPHL